MKILFAHNFYQIGGGEDTVLEQEMELLKKAGHSVFLYSVHNDQIRGLRKRVKALLNVSYSNSQQQSFGEALETFRPDVVHVHNFFPLLTPAIYDACNQRDMPVVQTLHNYRIMCAGAQLLRDGKVCELCIKGTPYFGALHRCYRQSLPGSLAVAHFISKHRKQKTWSKNIDRLIALTQFSKTKYIEAGIDPSLIVVKPNFIEDPLEGSLPMPMETRNGVLFVGRLSREKGIPELLASWRGVDITLTIVGDGPLRASVEKEKNPNIRILGNVSRDRVSQAMATARILVAPSVWYEGFPMVLVEAFAHGLPIVATDLGNIGQIVKKHYAGVLFPSGDADQLQSAVRGLYTNINQLQCFSNNCRSVYENEYAPEINLERILTIYEEAIALHN